MAENGSHHAWPLVSGSQVRALVRQKILSPEASETVMDRLVRPDRADWLAFVHQNAALWGTLFVAAGVICFFAANWSVMNTWDRLGLMGGGVLVAVGVALWRGPDTLSGRLWLLFAGLGIGPLLAVYGQAFQSGAPLWHLFATWTAALVPLAFASRWAGLWFLLWLVGTGTTLSYQSELYDAFYFSYMPPTVWMGQVACAVAWEQAARRFGASPDWAWLRVHWVPRCAMTIAGVGLTLGVLLLIFGSGGYEYLYEYTLGQVISFNVVRLFGYALFLGMGWWYRRHRPDIFVLSGCAVSVVVLVGAGFVHISVGHPFELLLYCGLMSVLVAKTGKLLRNWHRESCEAAGQSGERHEPGESRLWDFLREQGLAEGTQPVADIPLSVRLMGVVGAWITALFLLSCLVFFFAGDLNESFLSLGIFGGICVWGGCMFHKGEASWMRQFALALSFAGMGAVLGAILLHAYPDSGWIFVCMALAAGFAIMPAPEFRVCATLGFCFMLGYGIGNGDVQWALMTLGLTYGWLREKYWMGTRWDSVLRPLLDGVFLSLLLDVFLRMVLWYWVGPSELADTGRPPAHSLTVVPLAFLLFGLCRWRGDRVGYGLTAVTLSVGLWLFYYTLTTTLLLKAELLCGSGAALLGLAWVLRQAASSVERQVCSFPRMATLAGTILLLLTTVGWNAVADARQLGSGRVILLRIAPVDPRAFLMGDYMALEYEINEDAIEAVSAQRAWGTGKLVLHVDQDSEAHFVRLDDGTALAPDEVLLTFRTVGGRVRSAAWAFYFEEGTAPQWEDGGYVELRMDKTGRGLVSRLLGENKTSLAPRPRAD